MGGARAAAEKCLGRERSLPLPSSDVTIQMMGPMMSPIDADASLPEGIRAQSQEEAERLGRQVWEALFGIWAQLPGMRSASKKGLFAHCRSSGNSEGRGWRERTASCRQRLQKASSGSWFHPEPCSQPWAETPSPPDALKADPGYTGQLDRPHGPFMRENGMVAKWSPSVPEAPLFFIKRVPVAGWTSLVVQWLRVHLPMQGTQVRSLVLEDPTCLGATKPVCHCWVLALEPGSCNYWALVQQPLKPEHSRVCAPQQEKPPQWEARAPPLESTPRFLKLGKARAAKTQCSQK